MVINLSLFVDLTGQHLNLVCCRNRSYCYCLFQYQALHLHLCHHIPTNLAQYELPIPHSLPHLMFADEKHYFPLQHHLMKKIDRDVISN